MSGLFNIVYILADDLGFGDVGFNGSDLSTPNIDALAAEATILRRFYAHPVCTASRVALLGGVYPHKVGLADAVIRPWHRVGFPTERPMLQEHLRAAGYHTCCFGKWHLGHGSRAMLPAQRGFDEFYGIFNGASDYWTHRRLGELDLHQGNDPADDQGYLTQLLGQRACQKVADHDYASRPLFLFVPFTAPHLPAQAPEEDVALFQHIGDEKRRIYAAQVYNLDRQVGRIIAAIKDTGQWDNTIVLFTSDNGGDAMTGTGANRPLRGSKRELYEGGVRAPAVLHFPGLGVGAESQVLSHIIDLHATALEIAGSQGATEGRRLQRILTGAEPRDWLLLHYDAVSYAFCRHGIKVMKNPERAWPAPRSSLLHAYDLTDVQENCNIADAADLSFIEQFELTEEAERIPPLVTPDETRPTDFTPPPNWMPAA